MTTTVKPIRIDRQLIDGELIPARGAKLIPATRADNGEVLAEAVMAGEADAAAAVAAAKRALPAWSATSLGERRGYLQALADTFGERHGEMVTALVEEFGTPTATADAIVSMSRDWFVLGQDLLVDETFLERVDGATVNHLPVGVAVLITPWNGASWFMAMKGSVALAAGCTVVFKPSERGIWQVQPVIDAIADAGLPAGVVNVVIGEGKDVGVALTRHPDVDKISLTGSTATGKLVARNAVETMKRVTLELGGKSPTVILDDADVDLAVPFALQAGLFNNGQACIAGTRILVPESRAEELKRALADAVSDLKVGDPTDPETVVGPLLDSAQYDRVQGYIRAALAEGAELLAGGEGHPEGLEAGAYVKPTLLAAGNDSTIAREEVFGPVLTLITYRDEAEAVRLANETSYGLHAYVASGDDEHGRRVASQIRAGRVMVNEMVNSTAAPFGGFKQSGIGREFGLYGIRSYLEPQAVFAGGSAAE